jgi:hypothetical protein
VLHDSKHNGFGVYTIPILRRPLDPLRGSRSGAEVKEIYLSEKIISAEFYILSTKNIDHKFHYQNNLKSRAVFFISYRNFDLAS